MSKKSESKIRLATNARLVYPDGSIYRPDPQPVQEELSSDYIAKGQSRCLHKKCLVNYNGPPYINAPYTVADFPVQAGYASAAINKAYDIALSSLVSSHLGEASMIEFIKEFDKAPALFSARTYASYGGYGAYKWGLKPFLSDLKEFSKVTAASTHNGSFRKRVDFSGSVRTENPPGDSIGSFEGTYFIGGHIDIPKVGLNSIAGVLQNVNLFLDTYSINPDLKTAWELTPFSFIADYFVPTSAFLDELHPRGWGSYNGSFTGSVTIKGRYTTYAGANSPGRIILTKGEGTFYRRDYTSRPVTFGKSQLPPQPWKAPSFDNFVSTAYVASQQLAKTRLRWVTQKKLKRNDSFNGDWKLVTKRNLQF